MTVSEFTNKAQQKIADLGYKIVLDIEESNSYDAEIELLINLYEFIENLNEPLNDWTDHFKNVTMEYYIETANLNEYAPVTFYGYNYIIGAGGGGVIIEGDGKGILSVDVVDGNLIITYTDSSTYNAGPVGVGANIFVVDVEAVTAGKSVNKYYKSNAIGQNVIDYVATDDTQLKIYIWWDGGKEWNGTMIANGITSFDNTARISTSSRCFTADAVVDITGLDEVSIKGNQGETIMPIQELTTMPTIDGLFFGAYPTTRGILQSELKDADQIPLTITLSESSNIESIIVENAGSDGFLAEEIVVTDIGNEQIQCFVTADHNFLTDTSKGIKFRLKTFTGSEGSTYDSTGVEEATLNNLVPTITFNSITYPAGQSALKDSETADIDATVTDYDAIDYLSSVGELTIPTPATYAQVKTVTRLSGQYNISVDNYTINAYRNSNGSSDTYSSIVQIAHADAVIDIVTPAARLISGGADGTAAQDHVITVQSDQELYEDPALGADLGTLQSDMTSNAGNDEFYETLQVDDSDAKGAGTFTISAKNLAGKVNTTINSGSSYNLGGFVVRRKYFAAFADEVQMGVDVVDTSKLIAFDKDLIPMVYVADQNDSVREYTIVTDDTVHWNDLAAIANNTTGLSFIEIEETP